MLDTLKTLDNDDDHEVKEENQRKKFKSHLLKPPSSNELNELRETENLFHSNLFRMQV
jgi:U3 small nucleolar RNA-associated protein 22